ncbi:MAG: TetR/AcrR family transcriptional regulator [Anaerolineae bacterium]|nr:TetR/AcrR family transcriptional regulator [Anaerolineae bacterium]
MSPRPNVSEERREQIMQAAEEIFIQKGFANARMDDIADETGLSKGTLYLYYKSKDELIIAILDRIFQRDFRDMDDLDLAQITAADGIRRFVSLATADASAMRRLMPVTYEFLALAFRNPVVQQALQHYFQHYKTILLPIIEHGMQTGEFRPVNAEAVAIAIGALFEGVILLWAYDQNAIDPIQHVASSIELLLAGIQASH